MTELFAPVIYPRVLAEGLTIDEIDSLRPLVGSMDPLESMPHGQFHAEEYDAMVIVDGEFHTHHWQIHRRLVFAKEPKVALVASASGRDFGGAQRELTRSSTQSVPAKRLVIPDAVREAGLAGLVESSCMPVPGTPYRGISALNVAPQREVVSLLQEDLSKPMVLAAIFSAEAGPGQPTDSAIWLPHSALAAVTEWLQVAIRLWRVDAPVLFPESADWHAADQWASQLEISARATLKQFEDQEEERLQRIRAEADALKTKLSAAVEVGKNWRRLLTGTGDELVEAVVDALIYLGFSAIDADSLPEHKGKKREDLRVIDGDWVAVAEVKGLSGAARSNALLQVTNAAAHFSAIEARRPDSLWYVVNAFREDDPSQRPRVLAGRDDDVAMFGDAHHGLVLDTRELFRIRHAVMLGTLSQKQAREQLMHATGLYQYESCA